MEHPIFSFPLTAIKLTQILLRYFSNFLVSKTVHIFPNSYEMFIFICMCILYVYIYTSSNYFGSTMGHILEQNKQDILSIYKCQSRKSSFSGPYILFLMVIPITARVRRPFRSLSISRKIEISPWFSRSCFTSRIYVTPFPNKVTFWDTGARTSTYTFEGTQFNP